MKKTICIFSFVAILFATVGAQNKQFTLPSAEVLDLSGKAVNTATFSNNGKPIIIDFFATWCKPCLMELNAIADMYDYEQKRTGVKVIIISVDSASVKSGRVAKFVRSRGWRYETYLDSAGNFQKAMNVSDTPETYIINGKGEVVWKHVSYLEGDENELFNALDKVIGSPHAQQGGNR